jgi:KDO2-lipid IV(A) lauroyltransferase
MLRLAVPRFTRIARRNLRLAFPEFDEARQRKCIDGCFRNMAGILMAVAKFPLITKQSVGDWIRYEGFEHFEAALRRGKGVVFATGHLGNWELSAYAHALLSAPMAFVVRPLDNPLPHALGQSCDFTTRIREAAHPDAAREPGGRDSGGSEYDRGSRRLR